MLLQMRLCERKINIFIGNDSCYTFQNSVGDLSEHLFSLSDLVNVSQQRSRQYCTRILYPAQIGLCPLFRLEMIISF
jgi:hypothetical protein